MANELASLKWRNIGPFRGGRCIAVAGDPKDPATFYFGGPGGVWKSDDAGQYWRNISDGFFGTQAVGALAVAESDPNVIYVGMGEACHAVPRFSWTSNADGVYRSTDAGSTWKHLGLEATRHIARVRIHPSNPDLVYVAALGRLSGPSDDRGVYRSRDGGQHWERILFRSTKAGAIDLSMDPNNPRILYAAMWETRRTFLSSYNGGEDSSLYRSTDGGDTWDEITANLNLPAGTVVGRIGVAVSPAQSGRVWALVDAEAGGLFLSNDGGGMWERVSDNPELTARPHYYTHVFADPADSNTVFVMNGKAAKSIDAGRTFAEFVTPHGDNHELWIDPRDTRRMINGNDGGACVSLNGGESWSTLYNQPTGEFYHITTDDGFPYRVYGSQQDSSAVCVPSASFEGAIRWDDCYQVGSGESGHIQVHPHDPGVVFVGAIGSSSGGGAHMLRYDRSTGQQRLVTVWPELQPWSPGGQKFRFQWTYPILISPHDPSVIYVCSQYLMRSTDDGTTWTPISPDLTRNDADLMRDLVGQDQTAIVPYDVCTIFSFAESPHEQGTFWAGSDDGLVHVSRDGSKTWQNVTPEGMPDWALVSGIEVSPHDPATAYVVATCYQFGDYRPYLFKTNDYGAHWTAITDGIPATHFTRVIREDSGRRGLLYCGTEAGVYVSVDDGASWTSLRLAMPPVSVHDLIVKGDDLVAATYGRGIWVLDDLPALRQVADGSGAETARLLQPRAAVRVRTAPVFYGTTAAPPPLGTRRKRYMLGLGVPGAFEEVQTLNGGIERRFIDCGENPTDGAVIHYYLHERPSQEITLDFLDDQGNLIRSFTSDRVEHLDGGTLLPRTVVLTKNAGANRFVWDMRHEPASKIAGDAAQRGGSLLGPVAPPGEYQVRLTVAGGQHVQSLRIEKGPHVTASLEDLDAQFSLLVDIRDRLSETHEAVNVVRDLRRRLDDRAREFVSGSPDATRVDGAVLRIEAIQEQLLGIEGELNGKAVPGRARGRQPGLAQKIAALASVVDSADWVPTRGSVEVVEELAQRAENQLGALEQLLAGELQEFGDLVQRTGAPQLLTRRSGR